MEPRVLVGCPTAGMYKYCADEYIDAVKNLSYPNYDALLVDNSKTNSYFNLLKKKNIRVIKDEYIEDVKERIIKSRNILRDVVLKNDYDYFFSLEQDVIPPKDVIEKLLRHNKKIVSGIYYKIARVIIKNEKNEAVGEKEDIVPIIYRLIPDMPDKTRSYTAEEVRGNKLIEIRACGVGCLLIHRDVLEKIKFRCKKGSEGFDDVWFCNDAVKNGFKIYADTEVKCRHLLKGKDWSMFDNANLNPSLSSKIVIHSNNRKHH